MKQKTKLLIAISSFCLILATCLLSVFAVKNFNMNMAGEIEFVAPGIEATISEATLSGISKKEGSGQMQSFTLTRDLTESQISALSGVQSWKNIGLVFDEESQGQASISFTITNNSSKSIENIMVNLSTNTNSSSPIQATPSADFCLAPGANHTFTINLSVQDIENTASLTGFKLIVDMNMLKPSQVTSVLDYSTQGLMFSTNTTTKTASFTKYTGAETSLEIPAVVKDSNNKLYTVTEIKDAQAYSSSPFVSVKSTLKSIKYPTTLTRIGNYAFYACTALVGDLVIPDSVISVGKYAFRDCTGLTGNLIIGNNVKTIEDWAFYGCANLAGNLVLGNSLESISERAFWGDRSLTGTLSLPKSLTTIGDSAFYNCSKLSGDLIIPDTITTMGNYAFSGCSGFNGKLVISKNVKSIVGAFAGCSGLTGNLIIPESVQNIDVAFKDCKGFTGNLVIPDGITSIGFNTFLGCSGFSGELIIPDSVTTIGMQAFSRCTGFSGDLIIPDNVITVGNVAFLGCTGFTGELIVGAQTLINSAFSDCSGFSSLTIGSNVSNMEEGVFSGCSGLTSITVVEDNAVYYSSGNCIITKQDKVLCAVCKNSIIPQNENITKIASYAFFKCYVTNGDIAIPNTVTTIEDGAFKSSGITSITISHSVTSIGEDVFYGCRLLTSITVDPANITYYASGNCLITKQDKVLLVGCGNITIPQNDGITKIADNAFYELYALSGSITIPSTVTEIGAYAFYECRKISQVTIPNSVTKIGSRAFRGCSSLSNIYVRATTPPTLGSSAFRDDVMYSIYVPKGTLSAYQSAWSSFKARLAESSS